MSKLTDFFGRSDRSANEPSSCASCAYLADNPENEVTEQQATTGRDGDVTDVVDDSDAVICADKPADEDDSHRGDDFAVFGAKTFPTDLANWPELITANFRQYWASKGSEECQHYNASFDKSIVADGERQTRCCFQRLFTFIHPLTEKKVKRSWYVTHQQQVKYFVSIVH